MFPESGSVDQVPANVGAAAPTVVVTELLGTGWPTPLAVIVAVLVIEVPLGTLAWISTVNETLPLCPGPTVPILNCADCPPLTSCGLLGEPWNVTPLGSGSVITTFWAVVWLVFW